MDITASPAIKYVGLSDSFFDKASAIGAITSTVATFSTKIEIMPVIARIKMIAMPVEGARSTIESAIRAGTREYINKAAIAILPA